jgi:hypothetical protein
MPYILYKHQRAASSMLDNFSDQKVLFHSEILRTGLVGNQAQNDAGLCPFSWRG